MSQRIHLDATPGLFHQVLHCHQGDVGRQFEIAVVTRDGYEIPSGATFKIQATKPSGLGFTVTGTAANNIISFTSTEDMTSEAGEIPTQLEIKSGNDVIYTSNFLLVCEKNTHPESVTDGSPEEIISEITLLVERAESAASTAGADAAAAAQARVDEMMDYLPSEVADLKSDIGEICDVEKAPSKLFTGEAESNYANDSPDSGAYLSNIPIPANKYITNIKIKASNNVSCDLLLISVATSTVLAKMTATLTSGWNTLYWGVKTEEECYIAICGTTAKFGYKYNATEWAGYLFSTAGLYQISPTRAEVGDVVTISQATPNMYYAFAVQWDVVDANSMLYREINRLAEDEQPSAEPKLLSDESQYNTQSLVESVYFSNRTIPAESVLTKVKVKANIATTSRVIIVNADSKEITHSYVVMLNQGWNSIELNTEIAVDSWIGFERTTALFCSVNASNADAGLCTTGLYEGTPLYANVGETLNIRQTATTGHYAFAVQWEYVKGGIAYIANGFDSYYQRANEQKPKFKLNNGALLSYENISDSIGYMGRWFDYNGKPCTNNDGSELYFKTSGASTITADIRQITVQQVTPYIAVSIDGGAFVRQQISTPTISLPNTNEHIVRIVIDGMTEAQGGDKWAGTLGVYVNSITVDTGTISGIYPRNKVGMFFGDSITEGINALATGATATQNSAVGSYPYYCCEELNAVSYRVGYGATGMLVTGSFKNCAKAVDYYYENHPVGDFVPDFIVINHGINDYSANKTASEFIAEYENVINKLRVKYSAIPIFCVVPFYAVQPYALEIKSMCENYSNTYFVSTYAWKGETTDGVHLSVAGAENNGKLLAKAIKEVLGTSYFINLR